MKLYTVIYAITRDQKLLGDRSMVHECYHHFACVIAEDPLAAEALCRADTLPGFYYQTLVMFEGQGHDPIVLGSHVLQHKLKSPS